MRNKKIFSFDEEKDVEKILSEGFNNHIDYSKMYLIAKYFRKNFGYGVIRLERELIKFCQSQDKTFNPIVEAQAIKKWVKSAMKYELRKIDSVSICPKEINFIKSIENQKDKKIFFVTLILSKALKKRNTKTKNYNPKTSSNYYIRYNNFLDIIRLSEISNLSEIDLAKIFHKYKNSFTFYNPERELIRLEFVDENPDNEIEISDLSRISDYYELFFGKKKATGFCQVCGKEISKSNNRQKNCKECSEKLRKEQKRLWIKNARKNVDQ